MNDRNAAKFDHYAETYEALHAENVAVTGETTDYFARYKVNCLLRAGARPDQRVLDFGCGVGNTLVELVPHFSSVHGYEPSKASAQKARERAPQAVVHDDAAELSRHSYDVAVLCCVLHHVPPPERPQLMSQILSALKPGGQLFVFEHNPYNPLTRRAVATCPFDDDAILLSPGEQRGLRRAAGFRDVQLDYIVFFPKFLGFMRPLEPKLRWLPMGAQTMVRGTRPL